MLIKNTENNKYINVTLRYFDGVRWEPDCFGDIEDVFTAHNEIEYESGAICADNADIKSMVRFWQDEVRCANDGEEHGYLDPLTSEQIKAGCEWYFDLNDVTNQYTTEG